MNLRKTLSLLIVLFVAQVFAFSEVKIISPAPGQWANRQTLVVEITDGEEVFYSFSGTDPLASGFAYDGPVLLDVTGNVELRLAVVTKDRKRESLSVNYSVQESTQIENPDNDAFIKNISSAPVIEYFSGERIDIPFTLEYKIGNGSEYEKGRVISTTRLSIFDRFIPLSLSDGKNQWRFIIHAIPVVPGEYSRHDVPFKIENWDTVIFTDPKSIYSVDGSWWRGTGDPLKIDRTKSHMISWQSTDYKKENEIFSVSIPAKPALKIERLIDGTVEVKFDEKSSSNPRELEKLRMKGISQAGGSSEISALYTSLVADTFQGDKLDGLFPVEVYSDNVYQGTLYAKISVNRQTPPAPKIKSSSPSYYSRDAVEISASTVKDGVLYASIAGPVEIKPSFELPKLEEISFPSTDYSVYDGSKITLSADSEKIVAYKVSVYCKDMTGNTSQSASYSVIIDKFNYYVDAESTAVEPDGSPFAPYKDLSWLSKFPGKKRFARIFVKGSVDFPSGETIIGSNVEFIGTNDARVIMPKAGVLVVRNASFLAKDIIFEKNSSGKQAKKSASSKAKTSMLIFEHAPAVFLGTEIVADFEGDGNLIKLNSSSLNAKKSGFTVKTDGYGSVISSFDSKLNIRECRFASIAATAVDFSIHGGRFELYQSSCRVEGSMGRIAEFIGGTINISGNMFYGQFDSRVSGSLPLWKDDKVVVINDSGNLSTGF